MMFNFCEHFKKDIPGFRIIDDPIRREVKTMGNFAIDEAKALLAELKKGVVALETLLGLVQPEDEKAATPEPVAEEAPTEAEKPAA